MYANNKLENNPYWSMDYISGNRAFIFAAASAVQRRSALFHWCGQRTDLPEFDLSDTPEFWKRSIAVCDGYSNGSRKHRYSCNARIVWLACTNTRAMAISILSFYAVPVHGVILYIFDSTFKTAKTLL